VSAEQRIRAILFYLSLAIFLIGLPFILSFALSYKFDTRTLKFTKTGLIDLKTQPQGAKVYLDAKLLNERTPTTINEILPGTYNIRLELENHYSWFSEISVEAGKVTRLDKIILFPLRPNIKQISQDNISSFWVDSDKGRIYYVDDEDGIIYRSDLEGEHFQGLGSLPGIGSAPKKWKISPDKEKLLCFNLHQIAVVYLERQNRPGREENPVVLDYPNHRLVDVFWHSDNYHLILVSDKTIEVLEISPKNTAVTLVNLNKKNISPLYDDSADTLYFIDSEKASDGKFYDNVYKINLNMKSYPFRELMGPKTNEQ